MDLSGSSAAREGVGLIHPPRDVRELLEKTAQNVAGIPALEARVRENFGNKPQFSFLNPSDPYHPFYQYRISELVAAKTGSGTVASAETPVANGAPPETANGTSPIQPTSAPKRVDVEPIEKASASTTTGDAAVSILRAIRARADAARPEPRDPPPEDRFAQLSVNPPPASLVLDVLKLTAQHVARNGIDFQIALLRKESRNALFDFLKPTHPYFIVYRRFVDAYKLILEPPGGKESVIEELRSNAKSRKQLLDRVWYLHDWERQKSERELEAEQSASERLKSAQINWQDFVVLETIDLDDDDEALPPPIEDTRQLPRLLAAAEKSRRELERNKSGVDMEVDMDIDNSQPPETNVYVANVDSDIPEDRIRKVPIESSVPSAADVRGSTSGTREATVQLLSGQRVPLSQVEASMKAELLDPSYKEERARALEKNRLRNLAPSDEVARNLARLNKGRTEGEVYNRADLQKELSVLPKPSHAEVDAMMRKAVPSGPQLPASRKSPPKSQDLPPPEKRARVVAAVDALASKGSRGANSTNDGDEDVLIPPTEQVETPAGLLPAEKWIEKVGEKVPVRVRMPKHANPDWRLQGQELEMLAPLKSTVSKFKAFLARHTGLPANKQKLQCEPVGFLKDKMTLAFYNISKGSTITLEVKERGGRKKNN